MPKTKISEFSATPANNTDIDSINIAEGCAPSGINDAIRELMAQLKDFQTGAVGDSFNGPINGTVGATTPAAGAFTTLSASSTLGVTGVSTLTGGAVVQGMTVGKGAGAVATNTAVGASALQASNSGNGNNTAVGYEAGRNNTTGAYNTWVGGLEYNNGLAVGRNNTTGQYNAGFGAGALANNTTASNSTAVGYQAGYTSTGQRNAFFGSEAGYANTTGESNTYIGRQAGNLMTSGNNNTIIGKYSGNQGGLDIRTSSNYIVLSDGDGNPRGIFDGSGNFLVGSTSNTIGTDNGLVALKRATSGYSLICGSAQTGSVSYMIKFTYDNTTGTGQISTTNTTVSYATSSDYRLKNSVTPMTGALAKVAQLKPVTYKWNVDGSDGEGFIAHELAAVCPDAVTGAKDAVDADGNPVYQGIDTSFLVATLTAAIQELKAEFDAYKSTHP